MGKSQRDKGARRERQLVEMHRMLGVRCERVPLSGAVRYQDNGADIDLYLFGAETPPWLGECKARGGEKSGFVLIERWLADADFLALWRDRAPPMIVLPWARWQDILTALQGKKDGGSP